MAGPGPRKARTARRWPAAGRRGASGRGRGSRAGRPRPRLRLDPEPALARGRDVPVPPPVGPDPGRLGPRRATRRPARRPSAGPGPPAAGHPPPVRDVATIGLPARDRLTGLAAASASRRCRSPPSRAVPEPSRPLHRPVTPFVPDHPAPTSPASRPPAPTWAEDRTGWHASAVPVSRIVDEAALAPWPSLLDDDDDDEDEPDWAALERGFERMLRLEREQRRR